MQEGREIELNFKYSVGKCGFTAKEQVESLDGNLLRGNIKCQGDSG